MHYYAAIIMLNTHYLWPALVPTLTLYVERDYHVVIFILYSVTNDIKVEVNPSSLECNIITQRDLA